MSDEPEAEGPEPGMALVMTDAPVEIEVAPIEDERTPEGMVCLGTTLRGKLIARCVVSPDMWSLVDRTGMLRGPVPLALSAIEEDPGLQCRLFAVTRLPPEAEEEERENEPWAASVPRYEDVVHSDEEEEAPRQAAVLLGFIVRFEKDRKFKDSLSDEAVDVLRRLVSGDVSEVVDKVLGDLLGGE
ncbi:MAG TPA: hypothetical protein VJU15_03165 [Gemmatimonadales bacterium]|nr:hypothetical protein [Gemmatimonadales bacterium]